MSMRSSSGDYRRFDELAEEFAERYRRGERPSLREYIDRLPGMADEIREMFPALVELERVDGNARDEAQQPAASALPRPREFGDYRILREVGRGGMGVVYEAEQISLGRRVALKVLPTHPASDRAIERFRREAKAAAQMHHTNIVPVFEVGREGEFAFYAMQLIRGQGLDQVIDELNRLGGPDRGSDDHGPDSPTALADATRAHGLGSMLLRERGLGRISESLPRGQMTTEGSESPPTGSPATRAPARDEAKPFGPDSLAAFATENAGGGLAPDHPAAGPSSSAVLPGGKHASELDGSGRRQPFFRSVARIGRQAAQGLAHAHARGVLHRDIKPSNLLLDTEGVVWITDFGLAKADDDGLTATGDILGTLRYMAPERFRGQDDPRADIYALGMTLYELLTLRPAHESADRIKLIEQVKTQEPPRPRSIDGRIPRDLETIVLKAIDKAPEGRYASANAMAEDLRRFLADETILARRATATERYWRWARRNPVSAVLCGALTAILVMATIGSLVTMARFAKLANDASNSAAAEFAARLEADGARAAAVEAGKASEAARAAAQAETYRAMLSEVMALRAGHQLGWRDEALSNLARLAVMPTTRRDLAELRTEAVATVGEFGASEVARFALSGRVAFSIDFSPDSTTIVTACGDGNLDLWDVPARKHLRRLVGAAIPDISRLGRGGFARFLHNGDLAYLNAEGAVAFFDRSARKTVRTPIARGEAKAIRLTTDATGRWLAVGWNDGRIDLRDADTGSPRRSFDWEGDSAFALSPNGEWLALQGPGFVHLAPVGPEGRAFALQHGGVDFSRLAFSPDGSKLASVEDRAVLVWDLASRKELLRLSGHKETVTAVAFSADGTLIASSCGDTITRIWDAHDGRPLTAIPGPSYMQSLAFSPDGAFLAASSYSGVVCLHQLEGRREQRRLIGHKFGVTRLVPHPSLPRLASCSDDHAVILWDLDSARELIRSVAHDVFVTGLAIRPDGSLIASAQGNTNRPGDDFSIRLVDATSGALKGRLVGNTRGVETLVFDPTGRRIASGDTLGVVLLFEVDSGTLLRRDDLGGSGVSSLAFLDGGRSLLVGQHHGALTLIGPDGSTSPRRISLPDGCTRMVVNRRGDRAIVGDSKGALIGLSLPDLAVVHRLEMAHDDAVSALALSPDGLLLASGGGDRRVVLRDPVTFQPLLTFPPWTGPLKDVAFDSTGRWLAFSGADSEIALWDLERVRKGLAAVGLSWDQPAPAFASPTELAAMGERSRPQVPVIGVVSIDPVAFQEVQRLIALGFAAHQEGRLEEAVVALRRASERLEILRQSHPSDPTLTRWHGLSLLVLASALRDLKRPVEALAHVRESLAAYESSIDPNPGDYYNMACDCAMLSALDERAAPADREKLLARSVDYLRRAIEGDRTRIPPVIPGDHNFDPIRDLADFRDLMADATFPSDPFVGPSPLSRSVPETLGTSDADGVLSKRAEGYRLLDAGRAREGLTLLASALESDPDDSSSGRSLLIEVAALQAWFGLDAQLAATCRRALESARDTMDPTKAERAAKICCLRSLDDRAILDSALPLARRAVEFEKGHVYQPYFQMALGMAEYRSGNYAAADAALLAASEAGREHAVITGTSAFYRAMSLFRRGKKAEAREIAAEAASQMRPPPTDEENPLAGGASADHLILWMAYKEARDLLNLDADAPLAPPSNPAGP